MLLDLWPWWGLLPLGSLASSLSLSLPCSLCPVPEAAMSPPAPDCTCVSLAHPSFILTEASTHQGLTHKMANKEGKMLACFFFFFSPVSLWIPFCQKGVFMLETFSGKEILLSTLPCCCCFGRLHSPVPASAGATWPCCQHPVREAWGQLSIPPWAQGPQESAAHKAFNPLPCGFSVFLLPSPQTQGRVTNEMNHHVCHRDRRSESFVSVEMQISNCSVLLCGKRN